MSPNMSTRKQAACSARQPKQSSTVQYGTNETKPMEAIADAGPSQPLLFIVYMTFMGFHYALITCVLLILH